MKKDDIRRSMRARKAMLSDEERFSAAESVFERLEHSAAFMLAEHILMYHSLPDELSTHAFLEKWGKRKHFFLPRVNGVNLDILPYEQSRLKHGSFQIEEPEGDDTVDVSEIDMVVVPGVAFDRTGNRLGRGKGFYDRLLADCKATKVGVGYDFQLIEDGIDSEAHDVKMDIIIAGDNCYVINHSKEF